MRNYVVITPARDEEKHIEDTIRAVVRQTVRPVQWVIVDDGSRDATGEIIDRYGREYSWITPVHRPNRGARKAGGGVIETFYDGYAKLESLNWDFIAKLDADLTFAPDYFERCLEEFARDSMLGIGGGGIYHEKDGALELEQQPLFHVRGATKIYKRQCWESLGGLLRAPGWDTVDELKANMLGWRTRTFLHLQVSHHRFTGAADGAWKDCVKNGVANYVTGYHPLFMACKCMRRFAKRPYLVGSLGLLWGFASGYYRRIPQVTDRALIKYTRTQQLHRLLLRDSIWK